jgi:hypothetical protein
MIWVGNLVRNLSERVGNHVTNLVQHTHNFLILRKCVCVCVCVSLCTESMCICLSVSV